MQTSNSIRPKSRCLPCCFVHLVPLENLVYILQGFGDSRNSSGARHQPGTGIIGRQRKDQILVEIIKETAEIACSSIDIFLGIKGIGHL